MLQPAQMASCHATVVGTSRPRRVHFAVGDRVQARYLASKFATKRWPRVQTHWYEAQVVAIAEDGRTYSISYADGDYEESVQPRFVRVLTGVPNEGSDGDEEHGVSDEVPTTTATSATTSAATAAPFANEPGLRCFMFGGVEGGPLCVD